MRQCPGWLVWAVWLAWPCSGLTAEFTSSQGFSLQYPEGWRVLSRQEQAAMARETQRLAGSAKIGEGAGFATVISNPQAVGLAERISVVLTPGAPLVSDQGVEDYRAFLAGQFPAEGWTLTVVDCQRTLVGGREALAAHFDVTMPGVDQPIRQWQVVIPAGWRRAYAITCSAPVGDFAEVEPAFAAAIDSFRVTQGVWDRLPAPGRWLLIGVILAAAVAAITKFRRPAAAAAAAHVDAQPAPAPHEAPAGSAG